MKLLTYLLFVLSAFGQQENSITFATSNEPYAYIVYPHEDGGKFELHCYECVPLISAQARESLGQQEKMPLDAKTYIRENLEAAFANPPQMEITIGRAHGIVHLECGDSIRVGSSTKSVRELFPDECLKANPASHAHANNPNPADELANNPPVDESQLLGEPGRVREDDSPARWNIPSEVVTPIAAPISWDVRAIEGNTCRVWDGSAGLATRCLEYEYSCADKSRVLLTSEDGKKHCIKFAASGTVSQFGRCPADNPDCLKGQITIQGDPPQSNQTILNLEGGSASSATPVAPPTIVPCPANQSCLQLKDAPPSSTAAPRRHP